MRYHAATTAELNDLAENARWRQDPRYELLDVLDQPPKFFGQVLIWVDEAEADPTPEQWNAARALPPTTPLRDVLAALGVDGDAEVRRLS